MADLNIILAGIVGSTAYGLNHADSDVDMLGVYQAPLKDVLGFADHLKTQSGNDPDWQAHELGKFMKHCMGCNPTVSEMLWLPDELYAVREPAGQALILNRSLFLSARAFHSYGGYARQQFDRLKKAGNFDSDKKNDKAIEKHGRHLARLVIQGRELLETGQIRVRLTPEEVTHCREVGLQAVAGDFREIDRLLDGFDELRDKPCALPPEPDLDGLNDLLADLRMAPYTDGRPFLFPRYGKRHSMSDSLELNEEFFELNRSEIIADAPDGSHCVVISDSAVVQYFPTLAAALDTWASRDGAVVERLAPDAPLVAASSHLS